MQRGPPLYAGVTPYETVPGGELCLNGAGKGEGVDVAPAGKVVQPHHVTQCAEDAYSAYRRTMNRTRYAPSTYAEKQQDSRNDETYWAPGGPDYVLPCDKEKGHVECTSGEEGVGEVEGGVVTVVCEAAAPSPFPRSGERCFSRKMWRPPMLESDPRLGACVLLEGNSMV